jgi:arylformamidase
MKLCGVFAIAACGRKRAACPHARRTAFSRKRLPEMPMATADLESEYSPRVSVPDCDAIFARWAREAELYRAEMLKAGRAELGLSYGDTPRQIIDLFLPEAGENSPLALFIHGGYWRAFDPSYSSQIARGPNQRGIAVAVVGYDLCPIVTIGDIIEQIRRACVFLWQRFERRILVSGHSAGGHLAAAMVATDWPSLYPKAPADLTPAGYAISGVFDLLPLIGLPLNADLRLDADTARQLSPLLWPVPSGRTLDAAVGDLETSEFKRQSRAIAEAWQQRKAQTRYTELPGNHFTVIDPLADPGSAMVARVAELARQVSR